MNEYNIQVSKDTFHKLCKLKKENEELEDVIKKLLHSTRTKKIKDYELDQFKLKNVKNRNMINNITNYIR